MRRAGPWMGVQ